jgi:hypothetical protein
MMRTPVFIKSPVLLSFLKFQSLPFLKPQLRTEGQHKTEPSVGAY